MDHIRTRWLAILVGSPLGLAILGAIFGDGRSWSQTTWILVFGLAVLLTAVIVIIAVISRRQARSTSARVRDGRRLKGTRVHGDRSLRH